jgi:hypothetical protein
MAPKAKVVAVESSFTTFSKEADVDYLLARYISWLGNGFFSRAGYFAHAACEKYMKAFMVQESKQYLESHILPTLGESCLQFNPYFAEPKTKEILELFDRFEQVGRYGAAANYDPFATKGDGLETKGVMVWHVGYIQDLDAFVCKVRGLLNFSTIPGMDSLGRILAGDNKTLLSVGWKGPPLIIKVLTASNSYFKPTSL